MSDTILASVLPRERLTSEVDAFLAAEAGLGVEATGGLDSALRDALGTTEIRSIRGVLNGTTSYILSRLAEGRSFADALAAAQALGFAGADPSRDLSGEDAADRLRILAWLAFGVAPDALRVRRRGLGTDPARLADDARLLGGVPRLVAEAVDFRGEGTGDRGQPAGIVAAVEPVIVAPGSDLGRARGEESVVLVESRRNGSVRLSGPGDMLRAVAPAGRPHASARVSVEDSRAHTWVLGTRRELHTQGVLDRTLRRAGVGLSDILAEPGRLVAVTRPVPWPRIDLAARVLESHGLAPVVSRCEVRV